MSRDPYDPQQHQIEILGEIRDAIRDLNDQADENRLAIQIHTYESIKHRLSGCGWKFDSKVDGQPMCPCRGYARQVLVEEGRGQ